MPVNRFFLSDFVAIQRNSFLNFLEKGLIEEFSKRNPITNTSNTLEIFFYPEYYQLTMPKYNTRESIIKNKSYASRLYMPVQLTDKQARIIKFKWVYLGDLPIMTKRGHFIINGAARVIVNQIIRSPGIYYQTKMYENFTSQWEQKAESFYERHYADLICQRGTWLRLEIDRDKKIWAQTKRGPKIPIMWLLIALGLNEKMIFKSVLDPQRLIYNMLADKDSTEQPAATHSNTIEKSSLKNGTKIQITCGDVFRIALPGGCSTHIQTQMHGLRGKGAWVIVHVHACLKGPHTDVGPTPSRSVSWMAHPTAHQSAVSMQLARQVASTHLGCR